MSEQVLDIILRKYAEENIMTKTEFMTAVHQLCEKIENDNKEIRKDYKEIRRDHKTDRYWLIGTILTATIAIIGFLK